MQGILNRLAEDIDELMTINYAISAGYMPSNLLIRQSEDVEIELGGFSNCSCLINAKTCSTEGGFYQYNPFNESTTLLYSVMGIRMACSPQKSTIMSSLACWYSSKCLNTVVEFWKNRTANFLFAPAPLNPALDINFNASFSIETLWKRVMRDEISTQFLYDEFFSECAATNCTYSTYERQNILIIITSLVSVYSGLSVALELLTPIIIHVIYWSWGHILERPRIRHILDGLRGKLIALNCFFSRRRSSPLTLKAELYATRLYLVLWIFVFGILLGYNSLAHETITVNVQQPTEAMYEQLSNSISSSIECPCSKLSIKYDSFTRLSIRLHQICNSHLIETSWIESIYNNSNWSSLTKNDFRNYGVLYFLIQQTLCYMAQRSSNQVIIDVLSREIFKGKLISRERLRYMTEDQVYSLERWSTITFIGSLRVSRAAIQSNQLMNLFSSNWILSPENNRTIPYYPIPSRPVSHGANCSCATSSACTEPIYLKDQIVPGFVIGCAPIESVLRSNLTCLYNETCLQMINLGNLPSIYPLSVSVPTRYMLNSTVEQLTMNAFVEEWKYNISYSNFFSQCQPAICSYTISQRRTTLQIITILLGLYGGVTMILRFMVRRLINTYSRLSMNILSRKNTIAPLR